MRTTNALLTALVIAATAHAQSDTFAGLWKFNPSRSQVHDLPSPPDPYLKVTQSSASLTISASSEPTGPATVFVYPLDGRAESRKSGSSSMNSATKWEGAVLLVNTLVSGPQNYTLMERWKESRDGATLTITRTVVRMRGESESILVYENPSLQEKQQISAAPPPPPRPVELTPRIIERAAVAPSPAPEPATSEEYVVEAGTRVLLRLTNSVNTKHSVVGDKVYLETAVPIYVHGRPVIPRGTYVIGTVTESKTAGRVKGKAALNIEFDSLTLANGVTRDLRSRLGSVDTRGNLDRSEGRIEGESNKGGDTRTVAETTAAGTGVGAVAGAATGHLGMGAGIGAAAGAAGGLARVLTSKGPDVVLPAGTTMELVFDRDIHFTESELNRRIR